MTDGIHLMGAIERIALAYSEFLKIPDRGITGSQASMLVRIGAREMSVGALRSSGCYLGSNVSYNLKKLIRSGLLKQTKSATDGRVYSVRLTAKGIALREEVLKQHRRFVLDLPTVAIDEDGLVRFADRLPV